MSNQCWNGEPRRRQGRRGFSLLELMVALTILAIALVPVAYFYSTSLQMVEKASVRTRALMLAQERLAEVRQMPYDRIRSNVTPSREQLSLYVGSGDIDTEDDWFGYDFETALGSNHSDGQWAAMFFYPLPLDYNPYQPQTQGYNNAIGANHYNPNNPIAGMLDAHVNFSSNAGANNGAGTELDYEYEPIGFYKQKVFNRSTILSGDVAPFAGDGGTWDYGDIRMVDRRAIPGIEPPLDSNGLDHFRVGDEQQLDNYDIYGRRTIILDVRPLPQDADTDNFAPDDDRDGNATATNPYPLEKGPDNKFQVLSRHGTSGKMVIVQVFWLPRNADQAYIDWEDLNHVELRTFIAASNEDSNLAAGGASGGTGASAGAGSGAGGTLNRNDLLVISTPN